jgi:hypothetical protein
MKRRNKDRKKRIQSMRERIRKQRNEEIKSEGNEEGRRERTCVYNQIYF